MMIKVKMYLGQTQADPAGVQDDMEYIAVRNFYGKNGLIRKKRYCRESNLFTNQIETNQADT